MTRTQGAQGGAGAQGLQGAQGVQGTQGFQGVQGTQGSGLGVPHVVLGPQGTTSLASCPAGEVVLGGGFGGALTDTVFESRPNGEGWQATGNLISGVQAYAICAAQT
ncbi:hypothetical protein [Streptomyces laurentii]|uniref:hypothetical protein n=1 Tax=Streptomyces laurentii TaxID=39478 RepID=UPI0033C588F9